MNDAVAMKEISESPEASELTALRKDFWKKEFQIDLEILPQYTEELKKQCQAILLDEKTARELLHSSTSLRTDVIENQFADALVLKESRWWLFGFLADALSILMVQKAPSLNTHRMAYITGNNFFSMMAAATAVKLGFENIIFVVEDPGLLETQMSSLKRKFFGLNVEVIRDTELTLQPSNGSLLINTVSPSEGKMMIEDLTYLNFIDKKNSLIVEIPFSKTKNGVLEEAEHVNLSHLSSSELWAVRDFLLLKSLLPSFEISQKDYCQKWEDFLKSSPSENTSKVQ